MSQPLVSLPDAIGLTGIRRSTLVRLANENESQVRRIGYGKKKKRIYFTAEFIERLKKMSEEVAAVSG